MFGFVPTKLLRRKKKTALRVQRGKRFQPALESLERREVFAGFTTAAVPYLTPTAPDVTVQQLLTVGDSVGGYKMVGIPDGMGAFDNGDGTFTLLMNHELASNAGAVRAHGQTGAFVSKWVLDKNGLGVISGQDLIQNVVVTDGTTSLGRLCSADLPAITAFYNPATGLGTQDRIFMSGEEFSTARGFAHVVTGTSAGTSYQLPRLGKMAFENIVANPYAQDLTIVAGLDDSSRSFSSEGTSTPSEVYFYVGTKTNSGSVIDRAGLTNGSLYGVKVGTAADENSFASGASFTLASLGDVTGQSSATMQTNSINAGITQFRRVEDGSWDPENPNDFYFVTTDIFGGASRLWRLRFTDLANPSAGGTIDLLIDGASPTVPVEMMDNIVVDRTGHVMIQEDPGNQSYLAKIWQYDIGTGTLLPFAAHSSNLFTSGQPGFLTQDEESSGIIDMTDILGPGQYLAVVQAHYANPDSALVEGGQLLRLSTPIARMEGNELSIAGTNGNDNIFVRRDGTNLAVFVNGMRVGLFAESSVSSIRVDALSGNDVVTIAPNISKASALYGSLGNDLLIGGAGDDRLDGGEGDDYLFGNDGNDWLYGRAGNDFLFGGRGNDRLKGGRGDDFLYGQDGDDDLDGEDGFDWLFGGLGLDLLANGEKSFQ